MAQKSNNNVYVGIGNPLGLQKDFLTTARQVLELVKSIKITIDEEKASIPSIRKNEEDIRYLKNSVNTLKELMPERPRIDLSSILHKKKKIELQVEKLEEQQQVEEQEQTEGEKEAPEIDSMIQEINEKLKNI